jgi:hypothetical protein
VAVDGDLVNSYFPSVAEPYILIVIRNEAGRASGVIVDELLRRLQGARQ